MIDTEFEQTSRWILEILEEAAVYNLRNEVYSYAQQIVDESPTIDIIHAYQLAFEELTGTPITNAD